MIDRVEIKNFKSIRDMELNFTNFNLITGTNSSGKSSLIQSLLVMSQRNEDDILNGKAISLGTPINIINEGVGKGESAKISLYMEDGTELECSVSAEEQVGNREREARSFFYEKDVFYISANRASVMDIYPKNIEHNQKIGKNGSYTFDYFLENKDKKLSEKYYEDLLRFNEKPIYESIVNYWLKKLTGYIFEVEHIVDTNVIRVLFNKEFEYSIKYRPQHVGTGVSYILEQLIISLLSKEGDIIIVENPELHLHPKAQNELAEFYFWLSKHNRQIIIETHSDHFFNAVRVTKSQNPTDDSKKVYFFYQEDGNTTSINIEMGKFGTIENMQEELFDQFSKDLRKMLLNVEDDSTCDHQVVAEDTLSDEEFDLLKKEFEELLGDADDE